MSILNRSLYDFELSFYHIPSRFFGDVKVLREWIVFFLFVDLQYFIMGHRCPKMTAGAVLSVVSVETYIIEFSYEEVCACFLNSSLISRLRNGFSKFGQNVMLFNHH